MAASTGIADERLFEDLYRHFALASSWEVAPGALRHLLRIRASGVRLAVVSNFDTRLRPILRELGLAQLFHNITVSAEVGAPHEFVNGGRASEHGQKCCPDNPCDRPLHTALDTHCAVDLT